MRTQKPKALFNPELNRKKNNFEDSSKICPLGLRTYKNLPSLRCQKCFNDSKNFVFLARTGAKSPNVFPPLPPFPHHTIVRCDRHSASREGGLITLLHHSIPFSKSTTNLFPGETVVQHFAITSTINNIPIPHSHS